MKKMNGRMVEFAANLDKQNEKELKFQRIAAKAEAKMSSQKGKKQNSVFLKMMSKNHVFDGITRDDVIQASKKGDSLDDVEAPV